MITVVIVLLKTYLKRTDRITIQITVISRVLVLRVLYHSVPRRIPRYTVRLNKYGLLG